MRVRSEGYKVNFILVQQSELCSVAGFATIAEIAKERLRRAGEKVLGESRETELDVGFRVLKIEDVFGD